MAFFGRSNKTPARPVPAIAASGSQTKRQSQSSETTVIASGAKIEGNFELNTKLHIDGEVTGTIVSNNVVTIGSKGVVRADLKADKMIISGSFEGNADCNTVEILAGGRYIGKVLAKQLVIEQSGYFEGESKTKKDSTPQASVVTNAKQAKIVK